MSTPWVAFSTAWSDQVPEAHDWLSAPEREQAQRLLVDKRRGDYLLGRWTARRALAGAWQRARRSGEVPRFAVVAAADGAPEARVDGEGTAPFVISISHSHGRALVAVAPAGDAVVRVGCDLERVEPRSEELVRQFYTEREQQRLGTNAEPLLATLVWSAKESALKLLRTGLRADTRSIDVRWSGAQEASGWQRFWASAAGGPELGGYWRVLTSGGRTSGVWIATVLTQPVAGEPEEL